MLSLTTRPRVGRFLITGILVYFCTATVTARGEDAQEKAQALFDRAHAQSDLRVESSPPFRLEALVNLRFTGGVLSGSYTLTRQSKNRWRDEQAFPRYDQVRVSDKHCRIIATFSTLVGTMSRQKPPESVIR